MKKTTNTTPATKTTKKATATKTTAKKTAVKPVVKKEAIKPETTKKESVQSIVDNLKAYATSHKLYEKKNSSRTSYYNNANKMVFQVMNTSEKATSVNIRFSVTDKEFLKDLMVKHGFTPQTINCRVSIRTFDNFNVILDSALELVANRKPSTVEAKPVTKKTATPKCSKKQ